MAADLQPLPGAKPDGPAMTSPLSISADWLITNALWVPDTELRSRRPTQVRAGSLLPRWPSTQAVTVGMVQAALKTPINKGASG